MDAGGERWSSSSPGMSLVAYERARAAAHQRRAMALADAGWGESGTVPAALSALAHPVRHELLTLLSQRGEVGVAVLRQSLALSKPAVVYHTRILLSAGLIDVRRRGRSILYAMRPGAIAGLRDELALLAGQPLASPASPREG